MTSISLHQLLAATALMFMLLPARGAEDASGKPASRQPTSDQLQQYLKSYPDADTNKDGKLTFDEARTYLKKLRKSG